MRLLSQWKMQGDALLHEPVRLGFYILTALFAYISLQALTHSLTIDHGFMSVDGQYVGRDFLPFYAAGKQVLAGHGHDLYTPMGLFQANHLLMEGMDTPIPAPDAQTLTWPFPYPPHFLLLVTPFTLLPYYSALACWLALSVLLPAVVWWRFWGLRGGLWLAAIFNINVFACLIMGQNALILSSIAGIGIASVRKNPLLAGICFAIVSVKPHFAVLIPFALLLGQYRAALLYTVISTVLLLLISSAVLGWDIWWVAAQHFASVSDMSFNPHVWILTIFSTYRALINLGFSAPYAWAGHGLVALLALAAFQAIWRKHVPPETKWLAFGLAALLVTPFSFAYDTPWIILPLMAWLPAYMAKNRSFTPLLCVLLGVQLFAFAMISIHKTLAFVLILGALSLLFWLKANDAVTPEETNQ